MIVQTAEEAIFECRVILLDKLDSFHIISQKYTLQMKERMTTSMLSRKNEQNYPKEH